MRSLQISPAGTRLTPGRRAEGTPARLFPRPYSLGESCGWIANNLFGPSSRYSDLTPSIPARARLNEIEPRLKLGFFGDLMPLGRARLRIDDEVRAFFADVDVLVGNFEGTIVDGGARGGILALAHRPAILDLLADLFPPARTVLSFANNHVGDYGWERFERCLALVRERGFTVVGTRDEPAVVVDGQVGIAAATAWSNHPCPYLVDFAELERLHDPSVPCRVLCPHWGYEMQRYPRPRQIAQAKELLGAWELIVGHHSHCPQPVAAYELGARRRLVAYSLGNFTSGLILRKYRTGLILKVALGPGRDGRWSAGDVEWGPVAIDRGGRQRTLRRTERA